MDHDVIEFLLTSVGWAWMFAQADVELGNQHARIFTQILCLGTRFSSPNPLAFAHILFLFLRGKNMILQNYLWSFVVEITY